MKKFSLMLLVIGVLLGCDVKPTVSSNNSKESTYKSKESTKSSSESTYKPSTPVKSTKSTYYNTTRSSSGCPTTAACGCSGHRKAECQRDPCCKWTVGKGCGCR